MKHQFDRVDFQIVKALEEDGRTSFAKLAEDIGMSKSPCWTRVQALQNEGVIKGYHAELNPQLLGLQIKAMIYVTVEFAKSDEFEGAVMQHPNVLKCAAVTGDFDYVLEIISTEMQSFDQLLRKDLSRLPGVERFSTSVITREVKQPVDASLASLIKIEKGM